MNREELLRARGWVQHGAGLDLWQAPPPAPERWIDGDAAALRRRYRDRDAANKLGSVRFYPTAEQAQTSPLLAACAARGMCERDVIDRLFTQSEDLRGLVHRLSALQPPPAIHISADAGAVLLLAKLKSAEAIAAAWKALARAERTFAGAQTFGDHDAKGRAFQAIAAATAALRALGVDPDAADEPGGP